MLLPIREQQSVRMVRMKPSIKVLTLGVNDLERSLAFCRDGLGWATEGIVGTEFDGGAVAFFAMNGGLILALYPKAQIAKDADLPVTQTNSMKEEWLCLRSCKLPVSGL